MPATPRLDTTGSVLRSTIRSVRVLAAHVYYTIDRESRPCRPVVDATGSAFNPLLTPTILPCHGCMNERSWSLVTATTAGGITTASLQHHYSSVGLDVQWNTGQRGRTWSSGFSRRSSLFGARARACKNHSKDGAQ